MSAPVALQNVRSALAGFVRPANANSNQRFLTQEAARAAGFEVLGLLNEPSSAAVEFAVYGIAIPDHFAIRRFFHFYFQAGCGKDLAI